MDAGMLGEPLTNRAAGVTGEIVVDEVEVTHRVRRIDGVQELEEACGVPRWCGEGERLPCRGTQGAVDPDLIRPTPIVQRRFDAMTIRRPAGSRRKGAWTHWS